MNTGLTLAQYCEHRKKLGLASSYPSVQKAIQGGKLRTTVEKRGNRYFIPDPDAADQEWARNTTSGRGERPRQAPLRDDTTRRLPQEDTDLPSRAESQRRKEAAQAKMAELELEKLQGTLVEIEEVEKLWFTRGRQIRDAMEAIPARVIERLVAEIGELGHQQQAGIRLILEGEIKVALEELSRSIGGE